jgi:hypothetical protein
VTPGLDATLVYDDGSLTLAVAKTWYNLRL